MLEMLIWIGRMAGLLGAVTTVGAVALRAGGVWYLGSLHLVTLQ